MPLPTDTLPPDYLTEVTSVIPGYRELFEAEANLERLVAILKLYPVSEWLSFLARIQLLIAPPYADEVERHKQAFFGTVGPRLQKAFAAYAQRVGQKTRLYPFLESQLTTLQQLSILHSPEGNSSKLEKPGDFDHLYEALAMTWDLMHPIASPKTADETFAIMIQDYIRRMHGSLDRLGTRAFWVYQLGEETPSTSVNQLADLFQKATGLSMKDYLAGGLSLAMKEFVRSPDEIAGAWSSTLRPEKCPNADEAACLDAFHRIRCGTISEVRAAINRWDDSKSVESFSLIGVRSYPLIELDGGHRFLVNAPAAFDALFSGIRHAILGPVAAGKIPGMTVQQLGGIYGQVFEDYALKLLAEAFPKEFVRINTGEGERRADGLLVFPNNVIVFEVKAKYPRAADYTRTKELKEWRQAFEQLGVSEAADQIATTIKALRTFRISDPKLEGIDWTTRPITPVIIMLERLPLFWQIWPFYEELTKPLSDLGQGCPTSRVRFLHIGDLEKLPDLAAEQEFGSLLLHWANDPRAFECPLSYFLHSKSMKFKRNNATQRFTAMMRFLIDRFHLDSSKVKWPQPQ